MEVFIKEILWNGEKRGEVIFHDVTERKRAEETLSIKTTLLEAAAEATIDGILAVDEQGKIILSNKRFQEILWHFFDFCWVNPYFSTHSPIVWLYACKFADLRDDTALFTRIDFTNANELSWQF